MRDARGDRVSAQLAGRERRPEQREREREPRDRGRSSERVAKGSADRVFHRVSVYPAFAKRQPAVKHDGVIVTSRVFGALLRSLRSGGRRATRPRGHQGNPARALPTRSPRVRRVYSSRARARRLVRRRPVGCERGEASRPRFGNLPCLRASSTAASISALYLLTSADTMISRASTTFDAPLHPLPSEGDGVLRSRPRARV